MPGRPATVATAGGGTAGVLDETLADGAGEAADAGVVPAGASAGETDESAAIGGVSDGSLAGSTEETSGTGGISGNGSGGVSGNGAGLAKGTAGMHGVSGSSAPVVWVSQLSRPARIKSSSRI